MVHVAEALIILGAIAVVEALTMRFGKTSRDGEDWTNVHGPHLRTR